MLYTRRIAGIMQVPLHNKYKCVYNCGRNMCAVVWIGACMLHFSCSLLNVQRAPATTETGLRKHLATHSKLNRSRKIILLLVFLDSPSYSVKIKTKKTKFQIWLKRWCIGMERKHTHTLVSRTCILHPPHAVYALNQLTYTHLKRA